MTPTNGDQPCMNYGKQCQMTFYTNKIQQTSCGILYSLGENFT